MALPLPNNPEHRFSRVAFFERSVPMIFSKCQACGASEVVSRLNGSLQRWEAQHDCGRMGPLLVRK